MLKEKDRKIVEQFADQVRTRFPDAHIWVFGSRARGDANQDSDLDLLIVLERVGKATDSIIREIAWEISFENELVIRTVVMEREEFEHGPMSTSTLAANIVREGVPA